MSENLWDNIEVDCLIIYIENRKIRSELPLLQKYIELTKMLSVPGLVVECSCFIICSSIVSFFVICSH